MTLIERVLDCEGSKYESDIIEAGGCGLSSAGIEYVKGVLSDWALEYFIRENDRSLYHSYDKLDIDSFVADFVGLVMSGGKLGKSFSKVVFDRLNIKFPSDRMGDIGNKLEKFFVSSKYSFYLDYLYNKIDSSASDYGYSGSCWWSDYDCARRDFFSRSGHYALMFTGEYQTRIWCVSKDKSFVLFNAYGALDHYKVGAILSDIAKSKGMSIKQYSPSCGFEGVFLNHDPLGFAVDNNRDSYFYTYESDSYSCDYCGDYVHIDDTYGVGDWDRFCEYCYSEHTFSCYRCGVSYLHEDSNLISGHYYCDSCAERLDCYSCEWCGEVYLVHDGLFIEGEFYCNECEDIAKKNMEGEK